ncbi:MAG: hypothetical protein R3C14_04815 [Caldilineaceae bacterium]
MILIITGPPAAGKSTIGPLLARKLAHCAVADVDQLRAMVVQPHIAPWLGDAGMAQLRLGAQNGCAVARNCVGGGFAVVPLDVLTDETAQIYRCELADLVPQIVLLLPSLTVALARNRARGQFLTDEEVTLLYGWQERLTSYDRRIDNSEIDAVVVAKQLYRYALEQRA